MKAISLKLPKGAVAKGQLYPTLSPEYLDSDALDVRLPSGVVIDVGWYPSGDKTGQFYVTAFLGTWEHRLKRLTTRSPKEAASMAEGLAERFADAADVCLVSSAATLNPSSTGHGKGLDGVDPGQSSPRRYAFCG